MCAMARPQSGSAGDDKPLSDFKFYIVADCLSADTVVALGGEPVPLPATACKATEEATTHNFLAHDPAAAARYAQDLQKQFGCQLVILTSGWLDVALTNNAPPRPTAATAWIPAGYSGPLLVRKDGSPLFTTDSDLPFTHRTVSPHATTADTTAETDRPGIHAASACHARVATAAEIAATVGGSHAMCHTDSSRNDEVPQPHHPTLPFRHTAPSNGGKGKKRGLRAHYACVDSEVMLRWALRHAVPFGSFARGGNTLWAQAHEAGYLTSHTVVSLQTKFRDPGIEFQIFDAYVRLGKRPPKSQRALPPPHELPAINEAEFVSPEFFIASLHVPEGGRHTDAINGTLPPPLQHASAAAASSSSSSGSGSSSGYGQLTVTATSSYGPGNGHVPRPLPATSVVRKAAVPPPHVHGPVRPLPQLLPVARGAPMSTASAGGGGSNSSSGAHGMGSHAHRGVDGAVEVRTSTATHSAMPLPFSHLQQDGGLSSQQQAGASGDDEGADLLVALSEMAPAAVADVGAGDAVTTPAGGIRRDAVSGVKRSRSPPPQQTSSSHLEGGGGNTAEDEGGVTSEEEEPASAPPAKRSVTFRTLSEQIPAHSSSSPSHHPYSEASPGERGHTGGSGYQHMQSQLPAGFDSEPVYYDDDDGGYGGYGGGGDGDVDAASGAGAALNSQASSVTEKSSPRHSDAPALTPTRGEGASSAQQRTPLPAREYTPQSVPHSASGSASRSGTPHVSSQTGGSLAQLQQDSLLDGVYAPPESSLAGDGGDDMFNSHEMDGVDEADRGDVSFSGMSPLDSLLPEVDPSYDTYPHSHAQLSTNNDAPPEAADAVGTVAPINVPPPDSAQSSALLQATAAFKALQANLSALAKLHGVGIREVTSLAAHVAAGRFVNIPVLEQALLHRENILGHLDAFLGVKRAALSELTCGSEAVGRRISRSETEELELRVIQLFLQSGLA